MRRSKFWMLISVLILASMVLTACQSQESPIIKTIVVTTEGKEVIKVITQEPVENPLAPVEKVLRINMRTYPDIIDPQISSFVGEIAHLELIYEGLTNLDKDLNTVPGAAESWELTRMPPN